MFILKKLGMLVGLLFTAGLIVPGLSMAITTGTITPTHQAPPEVTRTIVITPGGSGGTTSGTSSVRIANPVPYKTEGKQMERPKQGYIIDNGSKSGYRIFVVPKSSQ